MRAYRDRQRSLEQLSRHIETWTDELEAFELKARYPLGPFSAIAPDGSRRSIVVGDAWADRHGIHRFELESPVTLPDGPGVELRLDFGGETLIRLVGTDGTLLDSFAANPCHRRFDAPQGVPFRIVAESAARSLFGIPNREPQLTTAEVHLYYPEVRALRRRLAVLRSTADTVTDKELARALFEAAEIALAELRLPSATSEVGPRVAGRTWARDIWERSFEPADEPSPLSAEALASVTAATERLDALLADLRKAYPKQGDVLVSGHAHIDYAWLWPQPETVRKILRTFSSVNSLMKRHPDFRFLQSSSLHYAHVEAEDPALYAEIKARIAEGRWEPIGGMLIECDTNMPSAEAFLRQFLFGQRYFEQKLGQRSRVAWLPDTFGFTGAMPQIMRHAGIDALVTIKISWNETNRLTDNLFRWQGNDGSRVFVHTFDAYDNDGYNMLMTPAALTEVWSKHAAKDITPTVIASYGWGDGGGGPDPDQIESLPLLNLMPAIPTVRHGAIEPHVAGLADSLDDAALPVWSGELYLEYHRATLTSQARVKQLNRRAEIGLVTAEALSVIDALDGGSATMPALADDWTLLLRNQFHDILPGSSIREVYEQTEPELSGIVDRSAAIADERLKAIAARRSGKREGLLIANVAGSAKTSLQIESAKPLPESLSPQAVDGGFVTTIDQPLAPLSLTFAATSGTRKVTTDGTHLENDFVRVTLDEHGRLQSLIDKRCGRELLDGPANRLMLYRNDLPRQFDAWDLEASFELGEEEWLSVESRKVTASGPHLAEIEIVRRHSASTIRQRLRLWANSPRLEVVTDLDWHDRRTYLRAVFPVNVLAEEAVFDQAIGVTRRATHDNTSWQRAQFEGSGHRFASLSETDWGAALLSADKYGYSAKGNRLTLSLMRGPMYPDMLADEGHHRFTYAILPHDGRWWSEAVQAEADAIANPVRFVPANADEDYVIAPVTVGGQQVRFHALKPAEDGEGYVLRLSEAAGRRGTFALGLPEGRKASPVNALEDQLPEGAASLERPFGLASFRF
jgi:alpha-mannosidase